MSTRAQIRERNLFREAGLAVAVLAIYVLTLLLPLHQVAGLQRDLNALGYSTLDNWSACQPLAQDENGDPQQAAALSCPASGIAKHQLAAVLPPVLVFDPPTAAKRVGFVELLSIRSVNLPDHVGQSRAPPVTV
ncbi:hypothetical protein [Devosia sediminis]|uniref:DUF2946 domain-containing protein n=1 Tax=Devosia sediminis TaxID=2798801 RepID=A0A934IZ57_9HYPH|nr:hypothetical protein [Devosia sediminis]MBJ3785921.1 hypothetical protein [Devosia sediminis]